MFTRKNRKSIQVMSQSFGHHPETSIRRKIPKRNAFLTKFLNTTFLSKQSDSRNLIPPAGLFQITIPRRCDLRTRTWSNSASEDYASSSFPLKRASKSELSNYLSSPSGSQRSFNRVPWFSKKIPSRGYSNKTAKIINGHNAFISRLLAGFYSPN